MLFYHIISHVQLVCPLIKYVKTVHCRIKTSLIKVVWCSPADSQWNTFAVFQSLIHCDSYPHRDGHAPTSRCCWRVQPSSPTVQAAVPTVWVRTGASWSGVTPADVSSASPTGGTAHLVCQTVQQGAGTPKKMKHTLGMLTGLKQDLGSEQKLIFVSFVCFRSHTCSMLLTLYVWWFRRNEAWKYSRYLLNVPHVTALFTNFSYVLLQWWMFVSNMTKVIEWWGTLK